MGSGIVRDFLDAPFPDLLPPFGAFLFLPTVPGIQEGVKCALEVEACEEDSHAGAEPQN